MFIDKKNKMKNTSNDVDLQYIKNRYWLSTLSERLFVAAANIKRKRAHPERTNVKSILIIRHNQLGDAVAASSFIRAAQEIWPNAKIDVLASKANREAFKWVAEVTTVFTNQKRIIKKLKLYLSLRNRYDIVFQTLFDEHYFNRLLAARFITGSGILVGRKRGSPLENLYDESAYLPRCSYVGKLMALLTPFCSESHFDLLEKYPQHHILLPQEFQKCASDFLALKNIKPGTYIALNVSAREKYREIGTQQATALAKYFSDTGIPVVLLFAPNDAKRAIAIKVSVKDVVVPNCKSLGEAMTLAQQAKLYVGPDTGTAHFAAAGRVPCLVLFSHRARPDTWSPYGVPFAAIQTNPDEEIDKIDQDLIVEYASRLLAGEKIARIVKSIPPGFPLHGTF